MARPKKVKNDVASDTGEAIISTPMLTEGAIGIYKQQDGSYYLAEVLYDPVTGEASLEDLHSLGTSKTEASERFKIEAVKKGFV